MSPKISVVVPAFNRAASIVGAVDSVLRQTFGDIEVIIVDDGSADDTVAQARSITDPRVRVVDLGVNRGPSAARNAGVAAARADWVAFQDSDDEWLPLKLERQWQALERSGFREGASYTRMIILVGERNDVLSAARLLPEGDLTDASGDISASILRGSFISTQTLMVRRDLFLASGGFDEKIRTGEDWELNIRLSQQTTYSFVEHPSVIQMFSDNSLTRNIERWVVDRKYIFEKHERLFRTNRDTFCHHLMVLTSGHRRVGDLANARKFARMLLAQDPLGPRTWARVLAAYAPMLTAGRQVP